MPPTAKRFVFRPLWITLGALATGVTLFLGVLQIGGWITTNAAWIAWAVVAILFVILSFQIARVAAVQEEKENVSRELDVARTEATTATGELAAATTRILDLEAALERPTPLSEVDKELASQLYKYSTDADTLDTLADFFPYRIPRGPVRKLEELADLPRTRSAYGELLSRQLTGLAAAARQWLTHLQPLVSADGDYYTTRLDHHVSEMAYQRHSAMTDELGSAGFDLHERLLEYQRYYASLQA